ncbi:tail fiber protein [bacterium]|nr:tail fiber protein [Candidatus Elulimicrobium humile]
MATILNKSDSANPNVVVVDGQLNDTSTSLSFVGKNYTQGYSQPIGENFLHLLENFSFQSPPSNPVQGQIWFNNNENVESDSLSDNSRDSYGLKIFDGQTWLPIGFIKKFAQIPTSGGSNLRTGDLFVDTERQQLYINNGEKGWTLVGPTFNAAEKTGAEIEFIEDADSSIARPILTMFVKTKRVAIISDYEFTPKSLIPGFRQIRQGITLTTETLNSLLVKPKFWGTAEKAESLISGDEIVSARNFIRSDQTSTTNYNFNVRNNNGINIGNDLSFSLGTDTSGSYIYNKIEGASIDLRLRQSGQIKSILRVATTATNTGAIGINNLVPEESLDVIGNIKTTDRFITTSTNSNSIFTNGGISIGQNALIIGNLNVSGLTRTGDIEPSTDSNKNLGTENARWDTIYAVKIGSNTRKVTINGTLNGDVNGNVSGYSGGFKDTVTLSLIGDLTATITIKDDGESKNIVTSLKSDFISQKAETALYQPNDLFLVERNQTLYKIRKTSITAQLPLVPTGTILLFAGNSSNLPNGYLICDGQEISQSQFRTLFDVIGYTYKPYNQLVGPSAGLLTFALPNLSSNIPINNVNYIIYTGKIV